MFPGSTPQLHGARKAGEWSLGTKLPFLTILLYCTDNPFLPRNSVYRCLVWPYRTCKQHRSNSSLPSRSSRNTRTAGGTAVVLSYSRRTAATHTSDRVTTTRGTAATHTSDRVTTTRGTAATHTSDRVTTTIGTAAAHTSETTTDVSTTFHPQVIPMGKAWYLFLRDLAYLIMYGLASQP